MYSKIIISEDFERIKSDLLSQNDPNFVKIFEYDELLLDGVKEIITEAYIAENQEKIIAILAPKFSSISQNALLKILEEPPKNIIFILVTVAKNVLLPTIRSRLMIEDLKIDKAQNIDINISNLDLKQIYELINEKIELEKKEEFSKKELLALVKYLVLSSIKNGVRFKEEDYEYFRQIYRLVELNAKSAQILTPLLLLIMQRQR